MKYFFLCIKNSGQENNIPVPKKYGPIHQILMPIDLLKLTFK